MMVMIRDFSPARLDIAAFAEAATPLTAHDALPTFHRLAAEAIAPAASTDNADHADHAAGAESTPVIVQWHALGEHALGEQRVGATGAVTAWLQVRADVVLPMVCQRCLAPVGVPLDVDRWFRFVADEATAQVEEEEADEDVLVSSLEFDLHALIEDELLMAIPITPCHEMCPEPLALSATDPAFDQAEDERPNPFAVLGKLRLGKTE